MKVKVINNSENYLPQYAHKGDAGIDLMADFCRPETILAHNGEWDEVRRRFILFSGGRAAIPTGLFTEIPKGYEMQVRPRSGLAIKQGITVLNAPGTIDAKK